MPSEVERLYMLSSDERLEYHPVLHNISVEYDSFGGTIIRVLHHKSSLLDETSGITYASMMPQEDLALPNRLYVRNITKRVLFLNAMRSIPSFCMNDPDELLKFIRSCKETSHNLSENPFERALMDPASTVGAARLRYLYLTRPRATQ